MAGNDSPESIPVPYIPGLRISVSWDSAGHPMFLHIRTAHADALPSTLVYDDIVRLRDELSDLIMFMDA